MMSRGLLCPLAPALLAVTCLTGCAAHAPESRPVPAPATDAPESRAVPGPVLDTQPAPVDASVPAEAYPQEARDADFQGSVVLKILIDETGRVRDAKVLKDPGHGLGEAAVRTVLTHFRFRPMPVAAWWTYTVTYELPRR